MNQNTSFVPRAVCGSWPLLTLWKHGFQGLPRQPATQSWPSWSVRLLAAPHSVGSAVSRVHRQPAHTPGPSWSVRRLPAPRSVGPAVPWAHLVLVALSFGSANNSVGRIHVISSTWSIANKTLSGATAPVAPNVPCIAQCGCE